MKINFLRTLLCVMILAGVSCRNDDDGPMGGGPQPPTNGGAVMLVGDVTTDVTLDASQEYELAGPYNIKSGAQLTIPAGTTIKATGETASFIAVERGAQIFINGTASNPVVMTSGKANPAPGDWGGLVIAGDAPTNKGSDVTSEVANLTYGGSNPDDNSGSITYLRVEYTGATFSNDKEFNGVSLFGVGSGTTFEYVQSFNGGDDGIEFFGGTVSGNNLISIGSGDDSIDFADGWQGSGTNWYIASGLKAGIEGSNNGDNGNANPVTTTTLNNITIVGPVGEGAIFYKEGGGKFTINNLFVSNVDLGVNVKDTDTEAAVRIENGDLVITNAQFTDIPTDGIQETNYTGTTTNFVGQGFTLGAGNGAGAPDWAAGWSRGLSNSATVAEELSGDITEDITLNASIEYILSSALVVKEGGKLTIPAGTTIKATGQTASFIAVERGAQIFINGTASNPVVMTSGKANPAPGDWGGLVIAGDAPTNKGSDVTSEVANLTYGGSNPDDNSGSITYLRVEYTGATFSNDKEFNGVSLFGVGSGTTFEYVQSFNGGDDGIEFFGGTVSGNFLVSTGSGDDSIDCADGYTAECTNWYISKGLKAGIEASNNGDNGNATPVTTITLSNVSIVGPVTEGAIFYKEGGGTFTFSNIFVSDVDLGVNVKDTDVEAAVRIENGDLLVDPIQFDNNATGFGFTNYVGTTQTFIVEGDNTGAGNGADIPQWAQGWTVGL